jgi:DNA-binding response OmpR family regulator
MSDKPVVCITDDSNEERLLLKLLLEEEYQVIEADSGEACLELIKGTMPDLLLLDVNMPGIKGYEVCETLRKQQDTLDLPIIFVSGLDSTEERLEGFESGGDEYIIKPINPDDLLEKVKYYLNSAEEKKNVHSKATEAMQVAMEAMTVSSELGQIVEFIKKGQNLETAEAIGKSMLEITKDFFFFLLFTAQISVKSINLI